MLIPCLCLLPSLCGQTSDLTKSVFTMLIFGSMIFTEMRAPYLHYRIVYVIVLCLLAIFWLSAWAWAASVASAYFAYYHGDYYYDDDVDHEFTAYGASMAAGAAIGAVNWYAPTRKSSFVQGKRKRNPC